MIAGARSRGFPPTTIAVALLTTFLVGVTSAYAGSITVAWDPSPDPSVVGYRVYVGTTSGSYTESFDAGNATTFTYNGVDGRTYYFAVAAYTAGPVIGPRSAEVVAGDATGYWSSLWGPSSTTTSRLKRLSLDTTFTRAATTTSCWEPEFRECVTGRTMARLNAPVSSLAATVDGRLFLVEGDRRVRVITSAGLAGESVLTAADASVRLNQVAVDPAFADTGFIWVSETQTSAVGARSLSIARYRVIGNRAVERAEILSRISLPAVGDAVFAIGAAGHIYVALPGPADGSDPHWGKVLRFSTDGTAPEEQSGSPILTAGYTFPHAMALEPFSDRVFLSGVEPLSPASELVKTPDETVAGRAALALFPHGEHHDLLSVASDGVLKRAAAAHDGGQVLLSLDVSRWGRPMAVTVGNAAEIYLSFFTPTAANSTSIVRLAPTR